jgi:hypothetical protein
VGGSYREGSRAGGGQQGEGFAAGGRGHSRARVHIRTPPYEIQALLPAKESARRRGRGGGREIASIAKTPSRTNTTSSLPAIRQDGLLRENQCRQRLPSTHHSEPPPPPSPLHHALSTKKKTLTPPVYRGHPHQLSPWRCALGRVPGVAWFR